MHILVVDDSKVMRLMVIRAVRQSGLGGLSFSQASSGVEALDAIREKRPDLVLTDLHMPEMNGLQLTQAIRDEYATLPVGMVTSDPNEEFRRTATESGCKFIVTKPFSPDTLAAQIEAHC